MGKTTKTDKKQTFWNDIIGGGAPYERKNPYLMDPKPSKEMLLLLSSNGKYGSAMRRERDVITYEYYNFDGEDQRQYNYDGRFNVEQYRTALEELQKTGSSELIGSNTLYGGRKIDYKLTMSLDGDDVHIRFSGGSSERTAGGREVYTSIEHIKKLEDLLLKE